jgi:O-antigen/teichoic acid export membrane protein
MTRKKTLSALIWSAAGQFGATGISTIFVLIFARFVPVEDFGVFAIGSLLSAMSAQLSGLGLNTALVQRHKLDDAVFSDAFWIVVAGSAAFAAVISFSAQLISSMFSSVRLAGIIPIMMLGMVMGNISALKSAILRREIKMKALANRTIAANLFGGAVAMPLAISGYGVYALVTQYLAVSALTLVLTISLTGWRAQFRFNRSTAYELLRYGVPVMKADLLGVFNMESPKFFIGFFLGATVLGIYSMASRLLNMLLMLLAATLANVAFPLFSEVNRDNPERLKKLYLTIFRFAALVYVPVFVFLALLSDDLVVFALGASWTSAGDITFILCLAGIPISLGYLNGAVAMAFGQPSLRYQCNLVGTVIGTVLLTSMTSNGLLSAGFALLLRGFISEALLTVRVISHFEISLRGILTILRAPAFGGISIMLLAWLVHTTIEPVNKLSEVVLTTTLGTVGYIVLVLLLDRMVITELRSLLKSPKKT